MDRHVKTEAGPEAIRRVSLRGTAQAAATGLVVDDTTGQILLLHRGEGLVIGPLSATDLRAFAGELEAAALVRAKAEREIAAGADQALARVMGRRH